MLKRQLKVVALAQHIPIIRLCQWQRTVHSVPTKLGKGLAPQFDTPVPKLKSSSTATGVTVTLCSQCA
jgi:hypothetical protein